MQARRASSALCLGLSVAVSFLCNAAIAAPQAGCPKAEFIQNSSGPSEVTEETIDKKRFQVIKILIKARPERVWHVLTDYPHAPYVFENLKKCQVVEDRGGGVKVLDHVIHPSDFPGTFAYRVEVHEVAPRALEWHRISGSFKEVDGYWKLEPVDNGHQTLVTYATYVNGGLFLPAPLIRGQLRDDMPDIMLSLKRESEASGTEIARRVDPNHRAN